MKKLILTLSVFIIVASIYGQELTQDTAKKEFKNVIGLDITGLLGQITYFNRYYDDYYPYQYPYYNYLSSSYIITYKRIYKKSALRLGIGGMFSSNNGTNNDTIDSKSKYNNLNIGAGYEHYGYISKKWMFYYGADIIGSYYNNYYMYEYSNNITREETTTTYSYGVSPLFGLIFRFNNRISIATETCYDIVYNQSKRDSYYSNNPDYKSNYKSSGIQTQYHAPSSLIIRIQF